MLHTTSRKWLWLSLLVTPPFAAACAACARENPPSPDTAHIPAPPAPAQATLAAVAPSSPPRAPPGPSAPIAPLGAASPPPVVPHASATSTSGGDCTKDGDCRLFSNYCGGCTCDALKKTAANPHCAGSAVNCVVDPCGRAHPKCIASKCARDDAM